MGWGFWCDDDNKYDDENDDDDDEWKKDVLEYICDGGDILLLFDQSY